MKKTALILLCLLQPMTSALAEANKPLSAEVLWQLKRIGTPVVAPAGNHIIAPVTKYDVKTDKSSTQLWWFAPNGNQQRPLTIAGMKVSEPVFSPDGSTLAFISKRNDDEAGQIYLLPLNLPGEAQRLSDVPSGVSGLKWVGKHLYFISHVFPGKNWEQMKEQLKADKDNKVSAHQWNALPYAYFDHWLDERREAHVFRIPADGGEVTAITQPLGHELFRSNQGRSSYDISADEKWIAFSSYGSANRVDPNLDLFWRRLVVTTPKILPRITPRPMTIHSSAQTERHWPLTNNISPDFMQIPHDWCCWILVAANCAVSAITGIAPSITGAGRLTAKAFTPA